MRGLTIATAVLALTLARCEAPIDMVAVADQAVTQFHQRLDQDKVADIKADADPAEKIASDRASAMLNAQRVRLGKVVSAKRTALKDDYGAKGRMISMTYETVYTDGKATEEFVYHVTGGKAVLASYSVVATDNVVDQFHKNLDAGDFDAIVATAGAELKGSEDKLRAILEQVHARAGTVKSTRNLTFNAYMTGADRTIGLTYETAFTNLVENEEFLFHITPGGKIELGGYFIKPAASK